MSLIIRIATAADAHRVLAAYEAWKYRRRVGADDTVWVAEQVGALIGLVRIAPEEGTLVLRGMRVDEQYRGRGVGTEMLRAMARWLVDRECYCIAYSHLVRFYGQIGFAEIAPATGPQFLAMRLADYCSEGLHVTIMVRSAVDLSKR
jgi:GNAT superfamily N-acetyltransferase